MELKSKIYLDYSATTPVDQDVVEAMLPYFNKIFGNPSSLHTFGQQADTALENSRETVASVLNCSPEEVIFTASGTESDNLALRGAAHAARSLENRNHILISPVEHNAVSVTARQLSELHNFYVEYLPVDEFGLVHPDDVAARLRPETALVSVIYANNEIGTINPIAEIGKICRQNGVLFHTDAVQAAAFLPIDVQLLYVDLLSLGAHKFYGPKGVGVLYNRRGTPITAAITGGSQEYQLRAGTHNIPYIVGLAEALCHRQSDRERLANRLRSLREHLIGQVMGNIPDVQLTGHPIKRLPNHTSFVFKGVNGNALLMMLDLAGFACSSGSACKTGRPEPSDVLTAIGFSPVWALGSLRISSGIQTTEQEIKDLATILPDLIAKNRSLANSIPPKHIQDYFLDKEGDN